MRNHVILWLGHDNLQPQDIETGYRKLVNALQRNGYETYGEPTAIINAQTYRIDGLKYKIRRTT